MKLIITSVKEEIGRNYSNFTFYFTIQDDNGISENSRLSYIAHSRLDYMRRNSEFDEYDIDYIRYSIANNINLYNGHTWCKNKKLYKYFLDKMSKKVHKHLNDNIDATKAKEHISFMDSIYDATVKLNDADYSELIEYINKRRLMRTLE